MTARPRPLVSPPSLLRLLVALIVLVVGFASGTGAAEAQNAVAAINPESAPAVGADGRVAAGHVGSETGLFDDFVSVSRVAPSSALDDVARPALPRGGATLSQERLDHIVLRHWPTSGATGAGKFAPGTSGQGLTSMIDDAVRSGSFRPNTNGRPGTIFEHDFGSTIGTNIGGNSTSRLRVVVDPDGNVITAFPF